MVEVLLGRKKSQPPQRKELKEEEGNGQQQHLQSTKLPFCSLSTFQDLFLIPYTIFSSLFLQTITPPWKFLVLVANSQWPSSSFPSPMASFPSSFAFVVYFLVKVWFCGGEFDCPSLCPCYFCAVGSGYRLWLFIFFFFLASLWWLKFIVGEPP